VKLNVLIVVVSERGRTAFDILVVEKYNDIIVETVAIGFPKGSLPYRKLPLFFCPRFFV
jgi:hypothetical protein